MNSDHATAVIFGLNAQTRRSWSTAAAQAPPRLSSATAGGMT